MKNIAILTCLNANRVCTGAGCLHALNEKTGSFARYADEPLRLTAFFHCPGCGKSPAQDEGTLEKLERLEKIGVECVHVGVCGMTDAKHDVLCPTMQELVELLRQRDMEVVLRTHG